MITKNEEIIELPVTLQILNIYSERAKNDNFSLDLYAVSTSQKPRTNQAKGKDDGASVGNWMIWIADESNDPMVPSPPNIGSMTDRLENEKVMYVTKRKTSEQKEAVQFWNGTPTQSVGNKKENITYAGIWQNILYVEKQSGISDETYAAMQKSLSQGIADAYIYSWKVKFMFRTKRPSMRIIELSSLLPDPPSPGYVSELATVSETAHILLSYYFPNDVSLWKGLYKSARNSSLVGGINFDVDNERGEQLGRIIGENIIYKLFDKKINKNTEIDLARKLPWFGLQHLYLKRFNEYVYTYMYNLMQNMRIPKILFEDVSQKVGPKVSDSGYAVFADMDNDGYLDLITNDMIYYQKNNAYTNAYSLRKYTHNIPISSVAIADYDNDGCQDIYLVGNNSPDLRSYSDILLKNTCSGSFVDISATAGIADNDSGMGASWADYNNDGFLDLYVSNWLYDKDNPNSEAQNNILYKNNGNGTFTNVTNTAKVLGIPNCPNYPPESFVSSRLKNSYQPIWFDYNNDGLQDLFVATDSWVSPLYKNNGDGTFEDVTYDAGLCVPGTGMGVTVSDYDTDGDFDLYVTNTGSNYFWQNNGNGTFTEIAQKLGVDNKGQGWGTALLDFDNDMDDDIFVVNGAHADTIGNVSDVDLRNEDEIYEHVGKNRFIPSGKISGLKGNWIKDSAAFADYNNDGYIDAYVTANRHIPGVYNSLYENKGKGLHSLRLKLVGTKSNRDAIGAVVKVTIENFVRKIPVVNGTSFRSQYSMPLIIGTGSHKVIESLEISWPSGIVQRVKNIATDRMITVTENAE